MLRVATERPQGLEFDQLDAGGFQLFLDRELPRPERIEVTLGRWPRRKLRVTGFGGEAAGGFGGVAWDSGGDGDGGGGGNGGGNGGGG